MLPVLANLAVRLTGLQAVLGGSLGTALGIAVNPVVALGASAESTPTAPVTTDPAERARKLANNTLPMSEWTAEEREAFSKKQGGGLWDWVKGKLGLSGASDDQKVKSDIATTAESVKKLADGMSPNGGAGGDAGGVMGAARKALGWAGRATGYSPASGGGSTAAKGALAANQKIAYAAALKEGLSATAARALVANMSGEGLAVPGDYHWDSTHMASGIVQWDPTRSAAIKAKFGAMPHQLSVADQTRAAIWEMKNKYPTTWRALQGDNAADMIGALVDNYERPGNRGRAKAQRMGYYRGFNPGAGSNTPTVTVNGTPSHADAPIGDQAVLDARNRLASGRGTDADRALERHYREQQNTPAGDLSHVRPGATGDAAHPVQVRTLGNYIRTTKPMAAKGEMPHPTNRGPGFLDPAHQKLADAMNAEAAARMKTVHSIVKGLADGTLVPKLSPHALVSAHVLSSIHHGSRSQHNERHGDHFHIHGTDVKNGLNEAKKVSARRDSQDRVRYGQG